jgi:hypothetical protein
MGKRVRRYLQGNPFWWCHFGWNASEAPVIPDSMQSRRRSTPQASGDAQPMDWIRAGACPDCIGAGTSAAVGGRVWHMTPLPFWLEG